MGSDPAQRRITSLRQELETRARAGEASGEPLGCALGRGDFDGRTSADVADETVAVSAGDGLSPAVHSELGQDSLNVGLGNATVVANLSANGLATGLTCTTPSGSNQAPGQNPRGAGNRGGTQEITNPKNGRARIDVTTATPTVSPKQAGCPNNSWIVIIDDVEFSTYTLTISQGGATLFTCNGSFDPSPSVDGQTSTPTC